MECNKDEAAKAKEFAEKRFQEKDILGAKRLALKAKTLYPSLEGLPGFLGALDIYIAADRKINGEVDWYGVLGVDPSADVDTVRKNYRKLALTLHPDKNQSVGADGAFKILSQAWSLLSDKGKRMLYDQKRNPGRIHQKITRVDQSNPDGRSVVHPRTTNLTAKSRNQNTGSRLNVAPPSARPPRTDTFWTACSHCKMQYEYLKHYLNHLLICPNCHESFTAIPMAPPEHLGHQSWSSYVQKQGSSHPTGTNNSARH
ncbi:Chaperone protein DnaJ-like protein, partial [Drosera capensis]